MERLYLETSSGTISYLERPGKYPVILLHGLGGSGNNWLKVAKFMPDKYRLIMPDLLGHGKSKGQMTEHSVKEQVLFLKSFIEALGLKEYALVGNSYGGWVAMKYSSHVESPSHLILIDSAGINPTVGETSEEGVEKFVDRVMHMNPKNDRDTIYQFVRKNATGEEKISTGELNSLPHKTLIIWGRKDVLIPVEYSEKLHNSIQGSTLEIIQEGGHIPHSTNAENVVDLMLKFLDDS